MLSDQLEKQKEETEENKDWRTRMMEVRNDERKGEKGRRKTKEMKEKYKNEKRIDRGNEEKKEG